MNRLDFAYQTVKRTLKACDESPEASEADLIFAGNVIGALLPFIGESLMRTLVPSILKVIHRVPPARRPRDFARILKPVLDGDEALRKVVEEIDATNRAARREWFAQLKRGPARERGEA